MLDIDRAKVEVPYKTRMWGSDYTCDPRFVEEALGDGNVLLGLQPLNTRPNYYLIRVDSTWHLYGCRVCKDECPDDLVEHIEEYARTGNVRPLASNMRGAGSRYACAGGRRYAARRRQHVDLSPV